MRTIKFRAWGTDGSIGPKMWSWEQISPCFWEWWLDHESAFDSTVLMQYTGLKDMAGVGQEIYEDDLIGTPNGIVVQVVYRKRKGQWWTRFSNTFHNGEWYKPLFEIAANSYLKVLGNIHEYKHLLDSTTE